MAPPPPPDDDGQLGQVVRRGVKSAVARWVLTRRRRDERTFPRTTDEGTHAFDGRRRFAEDFTFTACHEGLGLLLRTEWLPGREAHRVFVAVIRGDRVLVTPEMTRPRPGLWRGKHEPWKVGGLEIDCMRPHAQWSARYRGDLVTPHGPGEDAPRVRASLDLTFVAKLRPFVPGSDDDPDLVARCLGDASWDRRLLRQVRRSTMRGYVQVGQVHGTLLIGDELIPVRADALRQHNWGVRDWGGSDEAWQAFVSLPDGRRAFFHEARFPFVSLRGGFVAGDDGSDVSPLRELGMTRETRVSGEAARVDLHAEYGGADRAIQPGVVSVKAEIQGSVAMELDGRGQLRFGLAALDGGGSALWARQNRLLPRPPR